MQTPRVSTEQEIIYVYMLEFWGFSKQNISVLGGGLGYWLNLFIRADRCSAVIQMQLCESSPEQMLMGQTVPAVPYSPSELCWEPLWSPQQPRPRDSFKSLVTFAFLARESWVTAWCLSKGVFHPIYFAQCRMWEDTRGIESFLAGDLVFISASWLTSQKIPTDLT